MESKGEQEREGGGALRQQPLPRIITPFLLSDADSAQRTLGLVVNHDAGLASQS